MKRIGILGDIGAGKTYIAERFGFPVFDADKEVRKLFRYTLFKQIDLNAKYKKIFQKI